MEFQVLDIVISDEFTDHDGLKTVVRLFGHSLDGKSVSVNVQGFKPSFLIKLPEDFTIGGLFSYLTNLHKNLKPYHQKCWSLDIKNFKTIPATNIYGFTNLRKENMIKLEFPSLAVMRAVRRLIQQGGRLETFEASVDPTVQFINHLKLESWVRVENYRPVQQTRCQLDLIVGNPSSIFAIEKPDIAPFLIGSFDIEVYSVDDSFPKPEVPENACFQIATAIYRYGQEDTTLEKHIFLFGGVDPELILPDIVLHQFETEKELILNWASFVAERDIDFLLGYNVDGFDWEFLVKRARYFGVEHAFFTNIARSSEESLKPNLKEEKFQTKAFGTTSFQRIHIPGRISFDLLTYVRKEYKLNSYKLDDVSKEFLKDEKKDDVKPNDIFDAFRNKDKKMLTKVANYCCQDTNLPLLLLKKLTIIARLVELSRACFVPIIWITNRGQQIRVFSQIVRLAHEKGFVIPDHIPRITSGGGYADDNEEEDEFSGGCVLEPQKGAYWNGIMVFDFQSLYPSIIRRHLLDHSTIVLDEKYGNIPGVEYEIVDWVDDDGKEFKFKYAKHQKTILPEMLTRLFEQRRAVKKLMKTEKDQTMLDILDARQSAIKISMNSAYGFLAANLMPCRPISACVTAIGRKMINSSKNYVETNFPGSRVVYGSIITIITN